MQYFIGNTIYNYFNWFDNRPRENDEKLCMISRADYGYQWTNTICDQRLPSYCYRPVHDDGGSVGAGAIGGAIGAASGTTVVVIVIIVVVGKQYVLKTYTADI